MLEYKSGSGGETIKLSGGAIRAHIKTAGLYDYEWNVKETALKIGSEIDDFEKDAKKIELVIDFTGNAREREEAANHFYDVIERDILQRTPGRLCFKGYYLECYIIENKYTGKTERKRTVQVEVGIYAPYPLWIKETEYNIKKTEITSKKNKRYPNKYPYRYASGMNHASIINQHHGPANFKLIIYGRTVNPQIAIGGIPYLVNIVLEDEEYLEIDSKKKRITKVKRNGDRVRAYHNREKGRQFFTKIQPGRQDVTWPGTFDFDLILYEERSAVKW